MTYSPVTDFLGLWRNNAGQVTKLEMPGLDFMVAALARAGFITLSVSATAPVVSQSTTAWLQAAVPSYSAEGDMFLWDAGTSAYVAATPALFFKMLQAAAEQNGVSWWGTTGGPPLNTVGLDGDFAIQTDEPGGVYGPKAAGAWPADPLPGTTDLIGSAQLDATFGSTEGLIIYRGAAEWEALSIGADGELLTASGDAPTWTNLSQIIDAVTGGPQGSILYRDAAEWVALPPGTASQILTSGGAAANPAWAARTAEFPSGTSMIFRQTAAPTGWTKQTVINDYGLRVVSGAAGTVAGSAFSTVFAQTVVGNTTLDTTRIPAHSHTVPSGAINTTTAVAAAGHAFADVGSVASDSTGGGGSHAHSINLTLAYTDVIIATKD